MELTTAQRALLLEAAQTGSRLVLFEHDQATCGTRQVDPFPKAEFEALVRQGFLRKLTQGSLAYAVTEEGIKRGHTLLASSEPSS